MKSIPELVTAYSLIAMETTLASEIAKWAGDGVHVTL